jgi:hypothetical protein
MGRPKKTVEEYMTETVRIGKCRLHKNSVARHVYQLRHGLVPRTLCVCHTCDRGNCLTDKHHFLGTHGANVADAIKKGRMAGPEWRAAVSARVKEQHKAKKFGRHTWSESTKKYVAAKVGEALRGRTGPQHPCYGRKASPEQREHYRQAALERERKRRTGELPTYKHWANGTKWKETTRNKIAVAKAATKKRRHEESIDEYFFQTRSK